MKAAVYYETGAPEVLKYEDVAEPTLFADGLLIDVAAIAIQGGDTLNRLGGVLASKPHIVGYQAAGIVREVGANATGFAPGQAVVATMGFGSHAEVICPWAVSTWAIPNGLSLQEAAGVPIEFGTADDCLFEFGHLQAGETVLIQAGASGVGIAAIQLAKAAGATVIATSSSDERLEKLKTYGLDHGINYTKVDCAKTVMELTNSAGVNLVLDSVGGATLESSIASLAYRGCISWVGRAGREERPPEVWPIMQKNATITGVFLGAEMGMNPGRTHALIENLLGRIAKKELDVVIDKTFPLSEAAAAHRYIEDRKAFGRVLLIP